MTIQAQSKDVIPNLLASLNRSEFRDFFVLVAMTQELVEKIREQLKTVMDPELFISIVDLGLVYNISVSGNGHAKILMTLTTIGCPLFNVIEKEVREKVLSVPSVTGADIELTFDPPWDPSKMSDSARAELGIE